MKDINMSRHAPIIQENYSWNWRKNDKDFNTFCIFTFEDVHPIVYSVCTIKIMKGYKQN